MCREYCHEPIFSQPRFYLHLQTWYGLDAELDIYIYRSLHMTKSILKTYSVVISYGRRDHNWVRIRPIGVVGVVDILK